MLDADSPEEIIGKPLSPCVAPEYREALAALLKRVMDGEKISGEFQVVGLKGNIRWLDSHMVPFEDKANDRTLILAVTRDITERKRAEEELRRAKGDLERQNVELKKLDRIKDSLIHDVSHELKTPVAKHIMQLEILKPLVRSPGATVEQQQAFRVMEDSIRRQQSVIRNLLDLSRLESGERTYEKREMHLESFFARLRGEYQYAIDTLGARFDIGMPPVSLRSDEEMLWHVFSNLINNSLKFRKEDTPPRSGSRRRHGAVNSSSGSPTTASAWIPWREKRPSRASSRLRFPLRAAGSAWPSAVESSRIWAGVSVSTARGKTGALR